MDVQQTEPSSMSLREAAQVAAMAATIAPSLPPVAPAAPPPAQSAPVTPEGGTPTDATPDPDQQAQSTTRAILDYASRHREQLLLNIWRMSRNSIERGSRDHWTPSPSALDALRHEDDGKAIDEFDAARQARLHVAERRDPRAWVLPSDQKDFPTAVKFVNALQLAGVEVHRAPRAFTWRGKRYRKD